MHRDDGFTDFIDTPQVWHLRRVIHLDHVAIAQLHLINHAGRCCDQVLIELAFQALLHDLHVQQSQETAAKTKTQGLAHLRFIAQRRVVEFELFQRISELVVLAGLCRVEPGKHLWLDFLETRQRLSGRPGVVRKFFIQRDGVTHLGRLQLLDPANHKTHFTRLE